MSFTSDSMGCFSVCICQCLYPCLCIYLVSILFFFVCHSSSVLLSKRHKKSVRCKKRKISWNFKHNIWNRFLNQLCSNSWYSDSPVMGYLHITSSVTSAFFFCFRSLQNDLSFMISQLNFSYYCVYVRSFRSFFYFSLQFTSIVSLSFIVWCHTYAPKPYHLQLICTLWWHFHRSISIKEFRGKCLANVCEYRIHF